MRYWLIVIFVSLALLGSTNAQNTSNLKSTILSIDADTISLDSNSIIPGSLILEDLRTSKLINDQFELNEGKSLLIRKNSALKYDSVRASYRVFPISFTTPYYHKNWDSVQHRKESMKAYVYRGLTSESNRVDLGKMNYNGSISRGVTFGNSQDAVINSNLNLQFAGMLTNDIEVEAAISDDNIPIQPQGNTQQLQDFDQVYIKLKRKESSFKIGDINMNRPEDVYFMNYYRNVKGGQFATKTKVKQNEMKVRSSVAIARGKYNVNLFVGQEGNQGPYKLRGKNGEVFIIVLGGTERVFVDGKLLERGAEFDYIMDYNLGEITFTTNYLITKDSRIRVEFEYTEQNYLKSLTASDVSYGNEKWNIKFSQFSETDHKSQPINLILDDQDKLLMSEIGDSLNDAITSGANQVEFDATRNLYKQILAENGDTIYVISNHPDSAIYHVRFSLVGQGQGSYEQLSGLYNGRVYEYVGKGNGAYEPIVLMATPKRQQLFTVGGKYNFNKYSSVTSEFGLSDFNQNTYSKLHSDDDNGLASKWHVKHGFPISMHETPYVFGTFVDYEYVHENFKFIQDYRSAREFARDWNIINPDRQLTEHITKSGLGVSKDDLGLVQYQIHKLDRSTSFDGYRHVGLLTFEKNGYFMDVNSSILNTQDEIRTSKFLRPKVEAYKEFNYMKGIRLGGIAEIEDNRFNERFGPNVDSLLPNSYRFMMLTSYLKRQDTLPHHFTISGTHRDDWLPSADIFGHAAMARTLEFKDNLAINANNQLTSTVTVRRVDYKPISRVELDDEESVMGRVEYDAVWFRKLVKNNIYYEIGRGVEPLREYQYIYVGEGLGQYSWEDQNGNDTTELNEFFLDNSPYVQGKERRNYTRIFTIIPNEFMKTYNLSFNEYLLIDPYYMWGRQKGIKKTLSKFAFQTRYQADRKTIESPSINIFDPFIDEKAISDSFLVNLNNTFRNTFYFNRVGGVLKINVGWMKRSMKRKFVSDTEDLVRKQDFANLRWVINRKFTFKIAGSKGEDTRQVYFGNDDAINITQQFKVNYYDVKPKFTMLFSNKYRMTLLYRRSDKTNAPIFGGETTVVNEYGFESRINSAGKSSLNVSFSRIMMNFTDLNELNNEVVKRELLEGLTEGANNVWNVTYSRQLGENMQMSIVYDGRKSNDFKDATEERFIHVGSMQVRYIF